MTLRPLVAIVLALALLLAVPAAGQSPSPKPPDPYGGPDRSIKNGSAQRQLDAARRRWRRTDVHSYRFQLVSDCCFDATGTIVLFVRDDRPLHAPPWFSRVGTIPRLHRAVQKAIHGKVHGLSVAYDRRGIPRRLRIQPMRLVPDAETDLEIGPFWRGTKGRGGPDAPAPQSPARLDSRLAL